MTYLVRRPSGVFGDFDRMLNNLFESDYSGNYRNPVVDIIAGKDRYSLEVELPGLSEKDVEVKIEDSRLVISTVKQPEGQESSKEEENKYILKERRQLSFSRSFGLPKDADPESVSGTFSNGVLTINIEKKPETKPRSIKIKAA